MLFFKAKLASLPTHVPPIHVQTVASAQPLIPPISAHARPLFMVRHASKTSTSAPRLPLPALTAVCVSTKWARTTAAVLKSIPANTARPPTCRAAPHHARMEAPASRRETQPMTVAACQVSHKHTSKHNDSSSSFFLLCWHMELHLAIAATKYTILFSSYIS